MFVYRHCLSPRERVGVYCDALPRYQPYTFSPLAYTSSLTPHVLSLIENVFACADKWPQFLGHITDQISEATVGLGLYSAVAVSAALSVRACVCACSCVRVGVLGDLTCQSLRSHRCIVTALRLRQFMSRKREPKRFQKVARAYGA